MYIRKFHPGCSFILILPLRFLLSHTRPLFDFSSLEASPYRFPVREGDSRRGSANRSEKLDEMTIIIRSSESAMLRRVTPLLLASLPSSSECFLPFSFSINFLGHLLQNPTEFTAKQIGDLAFLNRWLVEELDVPKLVHWYLHFWNCKFHLMQQIWSCASDIVVSKIQRKKSKIVFDK